MPMEECFRIIIDGRGTDFDPDIVDAFLMSRDKIEEIMKTTENDKEDF